MYTRTCTRCNMIYPATADYFHRNKRGKYGLSPICKGCARKKLRKHRQENRERHNAWQREYYAKNREAKLASQRRRYHENGEKWRAYFRDRMREKYKSDPAHRIRVSISTGMRRAIAGGKDGRSWEGLVGYTLADLVEHLGSLFDSGMTWENYGEWHIDHIIPLAAFNYDSPAHPDFRRAWALENLQPMWASENISKQDKLEAPFQPSLKLEMTNARTA